MVVVESQHCGLVSREPRSRLARRQGSARPGPAGARAPRPLRSRRMRDEAQGLYGAAAAERGGVSQVRLDGDAPRGLHPVSTRSPSGLHVASGLGATGGASERSRAPPVAPMMMMRRRRVMEVMFVMVLGVASGTYIYRPLLLEQAALQRTKQAAAGEDPGTQVERAARELPGKLPEQPNAAAASNADD
ncbi:unnamed protein product [Lampetra planeri]